MSNEITPQDAQNLVVLLDRVAVTGFQEAAIVTAIGVKLRNIVKSNEVEDNGEDAPATA